MEKRLSIIINAHNASKYIEKCLRTLLQQKLSRKISIIVVYETETDSAVVDIIKKINNANIKGVSVTTIFPYEKLFLDAGYRNIPSDTAYLYFISGNSYFEGDTILEKCISQLSDSEEIAIFEKYCLKDRSGLITHYDLSAPITDILSSIIFVNNEYTMMQLGEFFSFNHATSSSKDLVPYISLFNKKVESMTPVIIKNTEKEGPIHIIDKDNWLIKLLRYYFSKYPEKIKLFNDHNLLLSEMETTDPDLNTFLNQYFYGRISEKEVDTLLEHENLANNVKLLISRIALQMISFDIEDL